MKKLIAATLIAAAMTLVALPIKAAEPFDLGQSHLPLGVQRAFREGLQDPPIDQKFLTEFYNDPLVQAWVSRVALRVPLNPPTGRRTDLSSLYLEFRKDGIFIGGFQDKAIAFGVLFAAYKDEVSQAMDMPTGKDTCERSRLFQAIRYAMSATEQSTFYKNVTKAVQEANRAAKTPIGK